MHLLFLALPVAVLAYYSATPQVIYYPVPYLVARPYPQPVPRYIPVASLTSWRPRRPTRSSASSGDDSPSRSVQGLPGGLDGLSGAQEGSNKPNPLNEVGQKLRGPGKAVESLGKKVTNPMQKLLPENPGAVISDGVVPQDMQKNPLVNKVSHGFGVLDDNWNLDPHADIWKGMYSDPILGAVPMGLLPAYNYGVNIMRQQVGLGLKYGYEKDPILSNLALDEKDGGEVNKAMGKELKTRLTPAGDFSRAYRDAKREKQDRSSQAVDDRSVPQRSAQGVDEKQTAADTKKSGKKMGEANVKASESALNNAAPYLSPERQEKIQSRIDNAAVGDRPKGENSGGSATTLDIGKMLK